MKIKELTIQAFLLFVKNSPLKNYLESEEYARFMGENGYTYDYIGLVNETGTIIAASLILIKKIGYNMFYGYAPKGFLLNYYDEKLVKNFTKALKEFYYKKNVVFIKINPEIVVGEIDTNTFKLNSNPNIALKSELVKYGFNKLKDNLYFEAKEPRFNAYIDLKNTTFNSYSKTNRNKVKNGKRKGLYLEVGTISDIDDFYELIDTNKKVSYYKSFYNIFNQTNKVELLLIKADFEDFIKSSQVLYDEEVNNNNLLNEILHRSHRKEDLNKKMSSDSKLCILKNEIIFATEGLKNNNRCIVAAALVVKYDNRVHIVSSGYSKKYASLNANYFLYDEIIKRYKKDYDYLDLNGVSGDFSKTNPYYGLNRFKLGFNAHIYEFIGEYDLVFNGPLYKYLLTTGKLAQELNKKEN